MNLHKVSVQVSLKINSTLINKLLLSYITHLFSACTYTHTHTHTHAHQ